MATADQTAPTDQPLSAQDHAASFSSRRRTLALVIVALAFVMDLLDSTIVNVAIPSIRTNLHAGYSAVQWIVAGYSLAFALLLVTGGRMGDVFGYKKVFLTGISGFTLASLLSGLSPDPGWLIAARLLQGAMAALMVPQVMSLMQVMYAPEERAGINGLFGALGGLSASLGPVLGGLLLKANLWSLDWRPIFLINVPIGLFGILAAVRYLPNGKSAHPLKLDLVGTGIVMAAMLLLVYPLIQGRDLGWPAWTFVMMATSLGVFGIFAWWQRRKMAIDGSPLVLPSLFHNRSFSIGMVINLVFEMAMVGFFLTFTLLLQIGLGYTALHAALTGLPTAVGIALTMALLGQTVIPKLGRYSIALGSIVMGAGLAITAMLAHHYGTNLHSWQLIPSLLLVGLGMGLTFASLFGAVLNGVDPRHAGSASGTLNAIQQVGGAIGVALIGVIFFGQLSSAAPASFDASAASLHTQLTADHVPTAAQDSIVSGVKACFVDRTREKDTDIIPPSCKQTTPALSQPASGANLNPAAQATVSQAIAKASSHTAIQANATNFANAFRWAIITALGFLALTFLLTFALPNFRLSGQPEMH